MSRAPLILISAGGTGGHLFPAEAMAAELIRAGLRVALATDERVGDLAKGFPGGEVYPIPSATPSGRTLVEKAKAGLELGRGVLAAIALIRRLKPAAVVGFGGYPTIPPLVAATLLKIPSAIHEQNGVMGRANRLLAGRVSLIATGFANVAGAPTGTRTVHTGNPVRSTVVEAARTLYPTADRNMKLRLLVFGGSQGARVMSEIVPAAVEKLAPEHRRRLVVTQQAREEDLAQVRDTYARLGVSAEVQPFFKDLPQRIANAHLVVGRSGASTVAELGVIGRPAILVPLPGALDQDQAANARALTEIGAALAIPQSEFTPDRLAAELTARFDAPETLTRAALAAKSAGIPDAAARLAAAVMDLAKYDARNEKTAS